MFVSPKTDCPHVLGLPLYPLDTFRSLPFHKLTCSKCTENIELWICLTCGKPFCGRYINNHYQSHLQDNPTHVLCLSILDLSVWCYSCETEGFADIGSYITSPRVRPYITALSDFKFGSDFHPSTTAIDTGIHELQSHIITNSNRKHFKYANFIELLKNGKFTKIAFMIGAGISTSAGIPDFRSENGIYQTIKEKFKVNSPEDFFSKPLFKSKPEIFYNLCKLMNFDSFKPTLTHYFMKYLIDKNYAQIVFTQNIDALETKAGINKDNIVFAHGTSNEAHCPQCNVDVDVNEVKHCINNDEVKYCTNCKGPCKLKVVLYGENLPDNFYTNMFMLNECDLVFIIGTSLRVEPFASLTEQIDKHKSWVVVINKELVGNFDYKNNLSHSLFIQGLCDEIVKSILIDCGWWDEFSLKYQI